MLNKTMWNIFKQTGNVYAYLYVKQYDKDYYDEEERHENCPKIPLEIKEIKIVN